MMLGSGKRRGSWRGRFLIFPGMLSVCAMSAIFCAGMYSSLADGNMLTAWFLMTAKQTSCPYLRHRNCS